MITPPALQKGDTIGILSTARKIKAKGLEMALQTLHDWGYQTVLGQTIGADDHQFAGPDELRAADLQQMLDNPDIKAILCARGGYGTVRIIDRIDFTHFAQNPKWIAGFSDITVLHNHIHTHFGIETIHGTMPLVFDQNTALALGSLKRAFAGEAIHYKFPEQPYNRPGKASGQLIGGNLSILYSLTGTNSDIDTAGKILFIEDLDEYLYHIDRMMMNLLKAGKLDRLAGLIVGGLTEMNDNENPFGQTAEAIISERVAAFDYPVCFGFPAGHISDNRAMYMGRETELEVKKGFCMFRQLDQP